MSTWLISVLSIVGGALLTLITTLIVNRVSYRHEYYKMIIEKRIKAYNNVEHLVTAIKSDSFKHVLDSIDSNRVSLLQPIMDDIKLSKSETLWLSKEMKKALNDLDETVFLFELENFENVDFKKGSQFHTDICNKIPMIEKIIKKDMMSLHKVGSFLRNKQI